MMGNAAMTFLSRLGILVAVFFCTLGPALAAPVDYMIDFQAPVTPVMERIKSFHDILLWICVGITVFVLVLLLWVMFRYSEKRNPTPSRTTHNVALELAWTVIPVLILIGIAFPSFRLLYFADRTADATSNWPPCGGARRSGLSARASPDPGGYRGQAMRVPFSR